ncbi:MAG: alanyl-tRNA editing protein [SAR202 cluster bacterium]|jgi:misacylated tRNA(Ala) deacylase|nr:alanyl-tRNA editing protein [SAR202 cluster bacterium]|tara:strand:+ start:1207 stop:1911 length:705 start_codon:yes stop_codon:yes gene_type:complete
MEILCYSDSYLKECKSKVIEVNDHGVVLDQTVFYPGGGGQPSDNGKLILENNEYLVKGLKRIDGKIIHLIEGAKPEINSEVNSIIDWDKRYKLMRTHTALHILCGVIWRDYSASVTGGDMKPLSGRMDFELEEMSADFSKEVEEKINTEVSEERNIKIYQLPREDAFQIPDLIRTKINLLPKGIEFVRIVNIQGLDLQADGGTHVHNTSEVGYIKMIGHESKGKSNKRLRIEVE